MMTGGCNHRWLITQPVTWYQKKILPCQAGIRSQCHQRLLLVYLPIMNTTSTLFIQRILKNSPTNDWTLPGGSEKNLPYLPQKKTKMDGLMYNVSTTKQTSGSN